MEVRVTHKEPKPPIEKIMVELTYDEADRFVRSIQMAGPFEHPWFFVQVSAAIEVAVAIENQLE